MWTNISSVADDFIVETAIHDSRLVLCCNIGTGNAVWGDKSGSSGHSNSDYMCFNAGNCIRHHSQGICVYS